MYCQGLGDCFLLTFQEMGQKPIHVLIDCGVLLATPNSTDRIREVAGDILKRCNGELDLLVVTHEHWDHLSGFTQARDLFEKIQIKQLWMSWAENPHDDLATVLDRRRKQARKLLKGMRRFLEQGSTDKDLTELKSQLDTITGFEEDQNPSRSRKLSQTEEILTYLRSKAHKIQYLEPGPRAQHLPGLTQVQFYVLGPPRNERLLRRDAPRKTQHEVYQLDDMLDSALILSAAHKTMNATAGHFIPFDKSRQRSLELVKENVYRYGFEHAYYGFTDDHPQQWRRIDNDWLRVAESLALKLDNDTNNTSLVLAIEFVKTKEVLLFPGDAQTGSWLSWNSALLGETTSKKGRLEKPLEDLLHRTIFYKVSHHGSHNGTLAMQGLEDMTHPELTAFMSVDEKIARMTKGWDMPFEPLLRRLLTKTQGRLVRMDQTREESEMEQMRWMSSRQRRSFQKRLSIDPSLKTPGALLSISYVIK